MVTLRKLNKLSRGLILILLLSVGSRSSAELAAPSEDLLTGELPMQVLIEVLVADIAHDQDSDFGVQHEFVDSGRGSVSLFNDRSRISNEPEFITRRQTGDLGSGIIRLPLTENPNELFKGLDILGQVLDVDSGQLFAAIQALAVAGKGEILSRPSIVTLENQEAVIETGQNVPFLTRKVTAQKEIFVSDQAPTGVRLSVTPSILVGDDGYYYVQMTVRPEVSFVSRRREERGIHLPVIASREAHTTVLVASGKTFILGGLYRDNQTVIMRGVPGLSAVPVLGGLFRSTSRATLKSELIISITPTVLDPNIVPTKRESVFKPEEKQIPERMQMELLRGWGEVERRDGRNPSRSSTEESPQSYEDDDYEEYIRPE